MLLRVAHLILGVAKSIYKMNKTIKNNTNLFTGINSEINLINTDVIDS